jgi:hypothetical protein
MPQDRRTTRYRPPLATGQARNRLRRFGVSTNPSTFDRLSRFAEAKELPMSHAAAILIEHALDHIGTAK